MIRCVVQKQACEDLAEAIDEARTLVDSLSPRARADAFVVSKLRRVLNNAHRAAESLILCKDMGSYGVPLMLAVTCDPPTLQGLDVEIFAIMKRSVCSRRWAETMAGQFMVRRHRLGTLR